MNKKGFKLDFKKHILLNLPYFAMFYVVNKLSAATQAAKGADISEKLIAAVMDFGAAFQNPLPSFNLIDLLVGAAAAGLFLLIVTEKRKNAKKFRHGVEYGSARWGTPKDIHFFPKMRYPLSKRTEANRKKRKRDRMESAPILSGA